jgi:nucleoside-diphosphate-sugar epimerase
MNVFLTGATGFIGQALVRKMRLRGWRVHALVRDAASPPSRWLAEQGCVLVPGDVTRAQGLAQAMTGMDLVIHNAGVYEFGANADAQARMQQVNVVGTDIVLGAALQASVPKTLYVSSVAALGSSGYAPDPAAVKDETHRPDGRHLTPYNRSKAEAHQVALAWRAKGLPLIISMPGPVVGANDHSVFGYFLRLYLTGGMPPMAFGGDAVLGFVDVGALAEGFCLAAEKAPVGQEYIFCGHPLTLKDMFGHFGRHPGGMRMRLWLPRWFMRPQMAMLEPVQRALGLPAFLSRETVDASRGHLNYSSAKARRELGWTHPDAHEMWDRIIDRERDLMGQRSGFLNRLKHQAVSNDPADKTANRPGQVAHLAQDQPCR